MEVRLIDANTFREEWLENGENEYVYDTNSFLESIDEQPTIDPEDLPLVKELREQLAKVTAELDDLKMNPPVKVDSDAFELALQLAEVTAERDLAVKYLKQANNDNGACYGCKWFDSVSDECTSEVNRIVCDTVENNMWEWKGLQHEN